jgi:endo-1,4-beta-mannosidase
MFLNTVRLAFYATNFNSKPDAPLTFDDVIAFIDPVVAAAKRHSLYVILDEHSYFKNEIKEETARGEQKSEGWTEERFENWVKRWVQVATYYKDEPYILGYELCNEPVCDPETARKWYKRCIDAIREVDKRHIIIVGTHNWSHSRAMEATWSGIADKIDAPYNNVVFSFHDYPQDDDPWKVQAILRAFQKKYNVPVMCTEFGAGGKPERVHREFQAGMLSMFAFERVGWMIWSIYYDKARASGYPTKAVKNAKDKTWEAQLENPGYWIPFVELWAPTARIMGSSFPEPASSDKP